MTNDSIITFWNSSTLTIEKKQATALKKLLLLLGAKKVSIKAKSIEAYFDSSKTLEKINKDILTPIQLLFNNDNIESSFGKVVF